MANTHRGMNIWPKAALTSLFTLALALVLVDVSQAASTMMHNSDNTSITYGEWGVGKDCNWCHVRGAANIKRIRESIDTPYGGARPVVFTRMTASNSSINGVFGDDQRTYAQTASTNVCEVCHHKTKYHRYSSNSTYSGTTFVKTHGNRTDCTICHTHKTGFTASCSSCHGNPPNSSVAGGPNGMAEYESGTTGFANPGAHVIHAGDTLLGNQGMACAVCHTGNSTPHPSRTVQLGFVVNNVNWAARFIGTNGSSFGSYSGTALNAPFSYASGAAGTTVVTAAGARNSCNVYCHGAWQNANGTTTPRWTGGSADAACGTCHGASPSRTPLSGSHVEHAGNASGSYGFSCSKCHAVVTGGGDGHVNGSVQWRLSSGSNLIGVSGFTPQYRTGASGSTGTIAPSGSFGDCTNIYCHSAGQGSTGGLLAPADFSSVVWGGSVTCGSCHKDMASSEATSGSHYAHANSTQKNYDCSVCHGASYGDATVPRSTGSTHVNREIDLSFTGAASGTAYSKYSTGGFAPAKGYFGTCSTAACHANVYGTGTVTTPAWGTPSGCEACHSIAIGTNGPDTGSHTAHAGKLCTECHAVNTTATTAPTLNHADGDIDILAGYPVNVTKHVAGSYSGRTCNNASCHANVYGTGTVTTPVWGVDANCSACHLAYPITASGPATGSHATHMAVAGVACITCHAEGTTATTKPGTGHADGDIDTAVGSYPTNITKHAAGTGYVAASCSTTSCHGSVAKTWGANSANASCTKCHGKGVTLANYSSANAWQAAPGYATTGTDIAGQTGTFTNGVSNDQEVGAHNAHLKMVNGYSDRQVLCSDCHTIPGTTNHATGSTDYAWSNLAKNIGTSLSARGALTPGYATGTCSNIYCHGSVLNGGSDTTPVWNDTTFVTAYAKNATVCGKCHGAPPTSGATLGFNHNAITIATSCNGCHGHEGNGPGHIDGNLQAEGGACNTCHSYDTIGGAWGSGDHLDGAVAQGWGAHAKHIDHLKTVLGATLDAGTDFYGSAAFNAVCGVCHTQDPANHTLDNSSGRMINFNGSTAYQNGQFAPLYLGVSGTASSVNPKTCSNLSCHFGSSPQWQ